MVESLELLLVPSLLDALVSPQFVMRNQNPVRSGEKMRLTVCFPSFRRRPHAHLRPHAAEHGSTRSGEPPKVRRVCEALQFISAAAVISDAA